jgi:hypothetical protein
MNSQSKGAWYAIGGVFILFAAIIGLYLYQRFEPFHTRTFCEAIADGATMDELTRMLADAGELTPDRVGGIIEDPPSDASSCTYTVWGGKVTQAKVIR